MKHESQEAIDLVAAVRAAREKKVRAHEALRVAALRRDQENSAYERACRDLEVAKTALMAFAGEIVL